jgi:hypothetical protein
MRGKIYLAGDARPILCFFVSIPLSYRCAEIRCCAEVSESSLVLPSWRYSRAGALPRVCRQYLVSWIRIAFDYGFLFPRSLDIFGGQLRPVGT